MPNEEIRVKIAEIIETAKVTCNPPCYLDRQIIRPEDLNLRIFNPMEIADQILSLFPTAPKEEKALYPCCDTSNKKGEPCPIHNPQEKLKEEKPNYMVALKDEIKKLLGQGKSRQTISSQLGLPFSLIQSIIDRNKLEEKPKIEELVIDPAYFGENQARLIQEFGDKINKLIRNANKE